MSRRLLQALPAPAQDGLLMARHYYPHLDAGAAWLAWQACGRTDDATEIAQFLTRAARREATAERIDHALTLRGSGRKDEDGNEISLDCADTSLAGADPAALIEGCEEAQEQMQQAGIVLHDPELASDTAALAQAYGRTRRRMQQVQAARAAAEAAGQAELFA